MDVAYQYDGSFAGFLTCVFESYRYHESPVAFFTEEDGRTCLYPPRAISTDKALARRVYVALRTKISAEAQELVTRGFLTCTPEKERILFDFIALGLTSGASVTRNLTDDRVAVLTKAVNFLNHETHLLTGFVRFTENGGLLLSEIEPKNRVLPLLRPHFCQRFPHESFAIYDRTHREALFYQPHRWVILPVEDFFLPPPSAEEATYRALWRKFFAAIAIRQRNNPKLQRNHLPLRYRATMTEFQSECPPQEQLPEKTIDKCGVPRYNE